MNNEPPTRGILRRILRWVPLAILVGTAALLMALVLRGGVAGIIAWLFIPELMLLLGACALVGTLVHAIRKRRWKSPAVRATLAGSLVAIPVYPIFMFHPMAYPASLERTAPAAAVRLPANVPLQVAWGGDDIRTNYHVTSPDQRWAYDLAVPPFLVGSARLEDYGCYGVPVVAPASGVVTAAHDGEPDATPDPLHENRGAPSGNHVSIRLDSTGTHLVIAHLQRGSVAVRPGMRVREGDVVGRCGNSGNSSEPHIHIHHQRQDPATVIDLLAEGLPLYFRDHDGEPMPRGGFEERDGAAVAVGPTVRHLGAKS